jgi:hypothetical protein
LVRVILRSSIFILLIGWQTCFASLSFPKQFLSPTSITKELRLGLINKLVQLRQNFIERKTPTGAKFISDKDVVCPLGTKVLKNESLVSLSFSNHYQKIEGSSKIQSYEYRNYYGCTGNISLKESIIVISDEKKGHKLQDQLAGELDLRFGNKYDSYDYKMVDGRGDQVLRIVTNKSQDVLNTTISIGNEKYISITINKLKNKSVFRYKFNAIPFVINRNGFSFEMNIPQRFEGFMKAEVFDNGRINYFNPKGIQVSLSSFLQEFQLDGFDFIMDSLLATVPKTKFFTSGNENARILEELRNAQAWIISGQDNLVRNLIESYIKDIKEGLILDKRPNR